MADAPEPRQANATIGVLIAGVGGQGNIAAADILARVALARGLDVKVSEVHGMAQRGGSVHSMVRFGETVHSPLIPVRGARFLVSLEAMEGARWLRYLAPGGTILASTERRPPLSVLAGEEPYPEDLEAVYRAVGNLVWIDAPGLAREAGSARAANVVMLGALSTLLEFTVEEWHAAIDARFKPAVAALNRKAFELGRAAVPHNAP